MDDILSQIIAYAPNKIDTELKARSMVQGPRNMYAGGGRMRFDKGGFTDADILEIKSKLPEGINIEYDAGAGGRWRYTTSISKADGTKTRMRLPMLKAFDLEADENLKKILEAKGKGKEVFDLSLKIGGKTILTPEKFYKLRLKDPKPSLDKFLEKLTKKGFVQSNGKPFGSRSALQRLQQELGIADLVGGGSNASRKRSLKDIKAIIRSAPNGPQILKSITNENELRKIANALVSRDRLYERRGSFPVGRSKENKMWHNLWRASNTGDRIEIIGEFADGKLPVDSNGRVNWQMPNKDGVPAWKRVQFIDNQKNKAPLQWIDMPGARGLGNQGQLRSQVDSIYGKGFFDRKMKPYDLQRQIADLEIDLDGQKVKVGTILNENIVKSRLMDKLIKENNGAVPTEAEFNKRYNAYRNKLKLFNSMNVQHTKGVGLDPYTTELTTQSANAKERAIVQKYNTAIKKTTDPTELLKLSNNFANDINNLGGGIRSFDVQTGTVKGNKATISSIATQLVDEARLPKETGDKINKLLKEFEAHPGGCGKAAGGRILFSNGGEAITACAKKGVAAFIDDLKKGNYSKATVNILKGGGNLVKNILNPMELLKLRNYFGPAALGFMAAFEGGVITDDVIRQGTPLNESLANNWLTKSFLPYTKDYAKAKNLLESGTVPSNMKKYVQDVVTFNEGLKEVERIENMTSSRIADVGGYGMLDGSSMYSKKQEDKDVNDLIKNMSSISEDVVTPGTAKALEMKALQDEMEATRMAKKKFSPIFGFDKLKDRNKTSVFDEYISATEEAPKDFRPVTYKDAEYKDKKLPLGLEQAYMNKFNIKPRDSLSNYFFKDSEKNVLEELTDEYNAFKRQEKASKYPGYFGTQDKFMEGGIASLNVKK